MPRGIVMDREGGGDQETVAMSNSAREGETRFDEFRASVVQATVRVPLENGGTPLRMFSPFKLDEKDKKKGLQEAEPSRVDQAAPGAAPVQISQKPGKSGDAVFDSGSTTTQGGSGAAVAAPAPQGEETFQPLPPDASVPGAGAAGGAGATGVNAVPVMPTDDDELEKSYDEALPKGGEQGSVNAAPGATGGVQGAPGIDPGDVFKDLGNPDKDDAEPQADGFTEEELW
jgi:hypothetical protein